MTKDRGSAIRGCLLGGAIGDALGYVVEFMEYAAILRRYGEAGITALVRDFDEGLALISDDTQMALYTANGLLMYDTYQAMGGGAPTPEQCIYDAYRDWYRCQCSGMLPEGNRSWLSELQEMHERRAPGNTCLSALRGGVPGSMARPVNKSSGCGGIMRVAPIGLWGAGRLPIEEIDRIGAEAAALTHGHPLGWMSAAALTDIVARAALASPDDDLYALTAQCRETMAQLFAGNPFLGKLLGFIDQAVELSRNGVTDVKNLFAIGEGWVGDEALGVALYCALKYQNDFSGAVIAAVNHSGDSDSTGAIAGNIVGAKLGDQGIEARWFDGLELRDTVLELSRDMETGVRPEDGEWKRKYTDYCSREE